MMSDKSFDIKDLNIIDGDEFKCLESIPFEATEALKYHLESNISKTMGVPMEVISGTFDVSSGTAEQIRKLTEITGEYSVGVDFGNGVDNTVFNRWILKNEIRNIHRVKKGKRWIIKYERTGMTILTGTMMI